MAISGGIEPAETGELRFACTLCGACCNRSPEVELSEAAALADIFVFRLMFRLYRVPRIGSGEEYFGEKRLLGAFAARKYATKVRQSGKAVEQVNFLMISALTLDTGGGACSALGGGGCGIYDRRPLACRTLPFHYSRPEASAERDLAAFVATPGHLCETGLAAPIIVAGGRIVDSEARRTRGEAVDLAGHDRRWKEAIVRRLKPGSGTGGLPGLREIEANAAVGALTTSMAVAWQIAAEAGLISAETSRSLVAAQLEAIDRELASAGCPLSARETLCEMRAEYQARLGNPGLLSAFV